LGVQDLRVAEIRGFTSAFRLLGLDPEKCEAFSEKIMTKQEAKAP
jgi:hypothetical protein